MPLLPPDCCGFDYIVLDLNAHYGEFLAIKC